MALEGVNIPKLSRAELEQITQDGQITQEELLEAGINAEELGINLNNPQEVRNALYDKYLQDNFGISAEELDAVYSDDTLTEEEIGELGLNVHGMPAQLQQELINVKLGKDLGLTPAEIESVMSASHMTQRQLLDQLAGAQGSSMATAVRNASDTISALGGKNAPSEVVVAVGPPPPSKQMSMSAFITNVIKTIATVLKAKGEVQKSDALMNEARLQDILIISEQKIAHQDEANRKQVQMVRKMIDHLNTMHALQIAITVIALVITIIVAVAIAVATGGAAAAASAALVIAVAAALASMSIAEAELNRDGKSMFNSSAEAQAVFWTLTALQLVFSFGASAAVIAAAKAAEITARAAVMMILFMISQMINGIMQSLSITKAFEKKAEENRDNSKAQADERASTKKNEVKKELQAKRDSGQITDREYRTELRKETAEIDSQRRTEHLAADDEYKSELKTLEIVGYVLMAASAVAGIGSGVAMGAVASALKQIAEKASMVLMMTVMEIIEMITSIAEASINLVMALAELQNKADQVEATEVIAEHKRATAFYEALEQMFGSLKKSAESIQKRSQESLKNLIEALMSVVDSNFKAMEKIVGRAV